MSILSIKLTVRCLGSLSVLLGLFLTPLYAEESLVKLSAGKLTDATVKTSEAGLVVSAAKENTSAGIKWDSLQQDYSSYERVEFKLKNNSNRTLTVWGEVGNKYSKGAQDRCAGVARIAPGKEGILTVRLMWRPKAPNYKRELEKFFMFFKGMNVRDNTIDPRQVAWVGLHFESKKAGESIDIRSVTPQGTRQGGQPSFYPFVDKYGQYKHVDWPGKVYTDSDLTNAADAKAGSQIFNDAPPSWNKYGGWEDGPTLKATGYFYAAQHKDKWWLVDPSGKLYWSYGPTGVGFGGGSPITDRKHWFEELPPKDGPLGEFYGTASKARFKYYEHRDHYETFNYAHANLKRAYGDNWQEDATKGIHGKLKKWGINTMGAWSNNKIYEAQKTPYVTMIHFGGPWITREHHYRMPDPFDEGFRLAVREILEKNPKTANDPWNIGYFVNNELGWGPGVNGNRTAIATLAKTWGGKKSAAKLTFINDLKAKYKTIDALNKKWGSNYASWEDMLEKRQKPNEKRAKEDLDAFSGKLAHQYFKIVREEVKRFAPNNMYLGCRFHGHIDNSLMAIAMEHVDVVSYNIYQNEPSRSYQYTELKDKKPLMVTEFGVGTNPEQSPWRGEQNSPAADQRERDLTKYLKYLLKNPQFVGAHFFQYHDQALTGRNDGEALLRGFVDAVGAPNFRLIEVNRNIMFNMYEDRLKFVPPKKPVKGTYKAPAGPIDDSFKKVRGIHHYSEQGNFLNKKLGWGEDCDTHEYSWDNSASIRWDGTQKAEGNVSYRFTLNKGWSRWVLHLNNKKTIDFTPYSAIKFAVSSKDAAKWDAFSVIIQDTKGNFINIPLKDVGFKPDGNFHLIRLDIKALQKGGVDMSSISTLLQISWGGGVAKGHSFNLDGLHVVQ